MKKVINKNSRGDRTFAPLCNTSRSMIRFEMIQCGTQNVTLHFSNDEIIDKSENRIPKPDTIYTALPGRVGDNIYLCCEKVLDDIFKDYNDDRANAPD